MREVFFFGKIIEEKRTRAKKNQPCDWFSANQDQLDFAFCVIYIDDIR